ncbi:peroxidase [Actinoplanes italicus]|uniref:Dyp-type peroxidase family n=1 Tax=Actinoplanes italicus TaxID=113567 RepID=A0A2T0K145_9ACTN|nr:Dyp-type peroxidase [Actinoplanes italicus]PRX16486.1 Dyp-type peroxidase family [Actinoplanes italicus]GIE33692.1 peroxidase [Actinoplanes italicus]
MTEPLLELDDIQAHLLPGFGHVHQRLLGWRLPGDDPAAAARTLLAELAGRVTPARRGLADRAVRRAVRRGRADRSRLSGRPATAVALSARTLRVLGHDDLATIDEAFTVGMARRSYLRDPPSRDWTVGGPGKEIDILVVTAGEDPERLATAAGEISAAAALAGCEPVHDQPARRLPGDVEHFGFRDGISQPVLRGVVDAGGTPLVERAPMPPMPDHRAYAGPGDVLVWPGQFLFGLPRQSETDPVRSAPARRVPDLARNGSLLVYRKLEQDVPGFRADTERMAAGLGVDPQRLRAEMVGRWPDGRPLVRSGASAGAALNHFGYDTAVPEIPGGPSGAGADPDGLRCPLAAHIRKVNPRDQETDKGAPSATLTFAILRRGITYGAAEDEERGLLFLCYQTDLVNQFELLAQRWANNPERPRQGIDNGVDLLIGRARTGSPRRARMLAGEVSTFADYVIPRGGAYLFAPSLSALRALAAGQ